MDNDFRSARVHHRTQETSKRDTPFRNPEEVAARDDAENMSLELPEPPSSQKKNLKTWFMGLSKKQRIIFICATVFVLAAVGVGLFFVLHKSKPAPVAYRPVQKTAPKPVAPKPIPPTSNLTGLPIADASVNDRPVTAVMIENSTFARPQSGLDQAGVVFEAVAEGGITRFVALFQDSAPGYIGPVRSVRPYYIQWLMGFDAAVAHVGGSPEALNDLSAWGTKNLDQFANGSFFHRISSRYAPHNVYTSIANLNTLEAKLGYGKPSYAPLARKPAAPSATPNASSIDFNISGYYYNVHYDYDKTTNTYKRSEAGAPHTEIDEAGASTQIAPTVVVGLVMHQGIEADDLHSSYDTIGSGQANIFQDGVVTTATWHKTDAKSNFTFTDANGAPIALDPGQTWFTALGSASDITYK